MTNTARVLSLLIALVALVSIVVQGIVFFDLPQTKGQGLGGIIWVMAGFFTILTNALVALTMLALAFGRWPSWWPPRATALACLAMSIVMVGIVYHLLLARLWNPQGMHWWADQGLHSAVPVMFLGFWLAFAPRGGLRARDVLAWLIYPLVYFVYALARGALDGWYPYPFLDVGQLGYGRVALNALGMTLAFGLVGLGLVVLGRWLPFRAT